MQLGNEQVVQLWYIVHKVWEMRFSKKSAVVPLNEIEIEKFVRWNRLYRKEFSAIG